MQAALGVHAPSADVVVMAAAVADFRPVAPAAGKLKKADGAPNIVLEPTPDLLAGLGAVKPTGQTLVGFAAETSDLLANAQAKLVAKKLDLIVANDVGAPRVGFAHDTNAVTLLRPGMHSREVRLTDKATIANEVIDEIVGIRNQHQPSEPPSRAAPRRDPHPEGVHP
jgi:phosphopantothenoylcysteine decarboxylase/phosphopantothenate--cysteine ligase